MERISRDDMFLRIASVLSERGTCGRAKVGALIVRDKRIISTGYNGPVAGADHCNTDCYKSNAEGCSRSVHAEANAIAYAARYGISTDDSVMYCTHAPCLKCAELIVNAGIIAIYYLQDYRDKSGVELLRSVDIATFFYGTED